MLGYAHINLITMLKRVKPEEEVREATDSLYIKKKAHCTSWKAWKRTCPWKETCRWGVQWRDVRERRSAVLARQSSRVLSQAGAHQTGQSLPHSTAPRYDDKLTRHHLSYLNGGGGSGKTTIAIELFRELTPTHRLAKEIRGRGVKAQTYHNFFWWSGGNDWAPERMGQKVIPRVIIWDEFATVSRQIIETLLDWLESLGVEVILCEQRVTCHTSGSGKRQTITKRSRPATGRKGTS